MPDLSPAALTIAKAILGPAYHPSKLTDPTPYTDAAAALEVAGLLRTPQRRDADADAAADIAEAIDDETWWQACEELWPELFTAGAVVSVTIAHLIRAAYTQAAVDVDLDSAGALGTVRQWFVQRGVPQSAAIRIAADVVAIHAVVTAQVAATNTDTPTTPATAASAGR